MKLTQTYGFSITCIFEMVMKTNKQNLSWRTQEWTINTDLSCWDILFLLINSMLVVFVPLVGLLAWTPSGMESPSQVDKVWERFCLLHSQSLLYGSTLPLGTSEQVPSLSSTHRSLVQLSPVFSKLAPFPRIDPNILEMLMNRSAEKT